MNNEKYILKYLENRLDEDEKADFLRWKDDNSDDFYYYEKIWNEANYLNSIELFNTSESWDKLSELMDNDDSKSNLCTSESIHINPNKTQINNNNSSNTPKSSYNSWFMYAAAASVILLIGVFFFSNHGNLEYIIVETQEEGKSYYLPDSSYVTMSKNTKLEYSSNFEEFERRIIRLDGKATFNVRENVNKPFVVEAGETAIMALGTIFEIDKSGDKILVKNLEGVVKFFEVANENNAIILQQGEVVKYDTTGFKDITPIVPAPPKEKVKPAPKPIIVPKVDTVKSIPPKPEVKEIEPPKPPEPEYHTIRETIEYLNELTEGTTKVVGRKRHIDYDEVIEISFDTKVVSEFINRINSNADLQMKNTKKCRYCFEISRFKVKKKD